MKSYKITNGQKNSLVKPRKYNGMHFNPRQDINGDWFIWEIEAEFCRENFGWELEETEFVEPVVEFPPMD